MRPMDCSPLLVGLQCCHSILGTAWPRPGCPQLAGARSFIGTKLFVALEKIVGQIGAQVAALDESNLKRELLPLSKMVTDAVDYLKQFGKQREDEPVDRVFNLLYLVTGVAYHRVAAETPDKPQQDARYSTVEDLADLLRLCAWTPKQQTTDPGRLLRELSVDLEAALRGT